MLEESDKSKSLTRDIFSILSKEGTLEILNETGSKLVSKRETHGDLGLTRRQYYSRLRELKNLGMIKKEGNGYIRTDEGEKIYKTINSMLFAEGEHWAGEEDISLEGILPPDLEQGGTKLTHLITSYDKLTDLMAKQIESSESELLIASRYVDHRVLKTLYKSKDRITVKGIVRKLNVLDSFEIFKAFLSTKELKQLVEFLSDNGKAASKLPFSFFTRDQKEAGIEIVNPLKPDDFFLGIVLNSEELCKELRVLFDNLYEISEELDVRKDLTL